MTDFAALADEAQRCVESHKALTYERHLLLKMATAISALERKLHESQQTSARIASERACLEIDLRATSNGYNDLKSALAASQAALRKYGRHDPLCAVVGGYDHGCTCGLEAALSTEGDV